MYWMEEHFKSLQSTVISNIFEALLKEDASIERNSGLGISTTLAQYICIIRRKAFEYETRSQSLQSRTEILKDSKNNHYSLDEKIISSETPYRVVCLNYLGVSVATPEDQRSQLGDDKNYLLMCVYCVEWTHFLRTSCSYSR